jgi:hypothetical protein
MTSDLTPSAAPTNINELRAKNPEPTHPDRDPTIEPASLIWPQKADTGAWREEEDRQEHSAALQYQAHCPVLPHTLAGVRCGHRRVACARTDGASFYGR